MLISNNDDSSINSRKDTASRVSYRSIFRTGEQDQAVSRTIESRRLRFRR